MGKSKYGTKGDSRSVYKASQDTNDLELQLSSPGVLQNMFVGLL